jgi:hypothetical protein
MSDVDFHGNLFLENFLDIPFFFGDVLSQAQKDDVELYPRFEKTFREIWE